MTRSVEQIFDEVRTVPDWFERPITSVHDRNGYGDTPLHIVANWGDCEAIKTLIEIGADINAKGEAGLTPLHCAVEQERPEAIVLLLAMGAEIIPDSDGYTPMQLAELLGYNELIKLFRDPTNQTAGLHEGPESSGTR
ncbi:ankyrin repeat domain-containing protein [Pseudomonas tohonis]|uniref:ankyrin repeat domain-containing protein n=1 Tax=Pseudomonas tohonis TaxID=2725477 RepID=UPI0022F03992|nr:ankyrin repeat domain-containing protein [Pseudomonas tohonis]